MNLNAVAAFADNYIWMLHDGSDAVVVDPGDAAPVIEALSARRLRLAGILVTHHHGDHVGGLEGLRPLLQGPVYGPAHETIPGPCIPCIAGDTVELLGLKFRVLDVPGHTAGHIAYYAEPAGEAPLLFCGDTLFSAGCGRLFEGTAEQMHDSLQQFAALPGDTRVCCAHEYTMSNLRFARAVEPGNAALRDHEVHCIALRERGEPTLPSTIALERDINPFLRCSEPTVLAAARAHATPAAMPDEHPATVLATLRQWKNEFR
ncbi:hydroxyacylglutathione hydrolase [Paucibacter sp. R3-3]|uniref:Hydroxyacylglutathione hydrolase n=1 Tax=Roseateles agri TaxID=3098619 RepID=A0ABU5DLI1_9BURK|nr:hydroxyacylglutathione hydrolase [Paucibacter sp. R3-3]MDY0747158.1 hydroxyacylglutathione hydrolase [Paucibacter sp. R3-3]